jgi:hypothetical protein
MKEEEETTDFRLGEKKPQTAETIKIESFLPKNAEKNSSSLNKWRICTEENRGDGAAYCWTGFAGGADPAAWR